MSTDWSKLKPPANDSTFTIANIEKAKAIEPAAWAGLLLNTQIWENGVDKLFKEYKNKVPTHDPYSNPDSHIYYECACGAILDPGTKSFAALNNAASNAGWKVRWGHQHYVPYCVKCGEGVE